MDRILIRVAGMDEPVTICLAPGASVVAGRAPDPERIPPLIMKSLAAPPRPALIASPRISSNHILFEAMGEGVRIQDLNSRNGSWLRLPPDRPVVLAGNGVISLELAGCAGAMGPELDEPSPVHWADAAEFSEAVRRSVDSWLRLCQITGEVRIVTPDSSEPGEWNLGLADGSLLHIAPPVESTLEGRWGQIIETVRRFVEKENDKYELEHGHEEGFILASPAIQDAHRRVVAAAEHGLRVLLLGPSGTGKERLAECYHVHSRQKGNLVAVNCAQLQKELLYVQLFGARRGSFTGAERDIEGDVEAASNGTLFLDEVGEMDPEVQKGLLRFLDRRCAYKRLGDNTQRYAKNVRIIAATNVDMRKAVRDGRFREDLYFRLAAATVDVPPLKDRPEDVVAFLRTKHWPAGGSLYDAMSQEARRLVLAASWIGNFRALEQFAERLLATRARAVDAEACRAAISEGIGNSEKGPDTPASSQVGCRDLLATALAAFEQANGSAPASLLGIEKFTEKYLKPLFVATATGLRERGELPADVNYSKLARALQVADGTTIRRHVEEYRRRFQKKEDADG